MKNKIFPLAMIAVSLLTACWFASDTDWNLFHEDWLKYYENHGQRLLQGHVDVDPWAARGERLIKDGRCYGYFGPVLALARMPFSLLFPAGAYHWSELSTLCAIGLTLLLVWYLVSDSLASVTVLTAGETQYIKCLLLINIGLGSSLISLSSPTIIYQETIAWSSALVLAASISLLKYLKEGGLRYAVLSCGLTLLAVNTRTSIGFGAVAMLLLTFSAAILLSFLSEGNGFRKLPEMLGVDTVLHKNKRHVGVLILAILIAATPFAFSYAKYGEFSLFPVKYHRDIEPERLARMNGTFVHLGNIPFNVSHYFNPFGISSSVVFPYFKLAPRDWSFDRSPSVHFDRGEPFLPIPVSMPLWAVVLTPLGLYGIVRGLPALRKRTPIVIGTFMGGATILVVAGITPRYIHDFFPFFVIAGTAGLSWLTKVPRKGRIGIYCLAFLLTVSSIYGNLSLCMLNYLATPSVQAVKSKIRGKLDGTPVVTPVTNLNSPFAVNGIALDQSRNLWGVVLPESVGPGMLKGMPITFASSGKRSVADVSGIGGNIIVWVDGPLDPAKDGAPALVEHRPDPCFKMSCGDTNEGM